MEIKYIIVCEKVLYLRKLIKKIYFSFCIKKTVPIFCANQNVFYLNKV